MKPKRPSSPHLRTSLFGILLFLFATSLAFASWNGADTLQTYKSEWDWIRSATEWNSHLLVNTNRTGIWMLELVDGDHLATVDSLSLPLHRYDSCLAIQEDTLIVGFYPTGAVRCVLTPEGFTQKTFYPETDLHDINFYGSTCIYSDSTTLFRSTVRPDGITVLDSLVLQDCRYAVYELTVQNDIALVAYTTLTNEHVCNIYSLQNGHFDFQARYVPGINDTRLKLVGDYLYQSVQISQDDYSLNQIVPETGEIVTSLDLTGSFNRLETSGSLLMLWNGNVEYRIYDTPSLNLLGLYQFERETEIESFFANNYFVTTNGEYRDYLSLYAVVSREDYQYLSRHEVKYLQVFNFFFEGSTAYLANGQYGVTTVVNVEQDNHSWVSTPLSIPIKRVFKRGNTIFAQGMYEEELPSYFSMVYRTTLQPSGEVTVTDSIYINGFFSGWAFSDNMTVLVESLNDWSAHVVVYDSDLSEEISRQISENLGVNSILYQEPYLYLAVISTDIGGFIRTIDLSDPSNPVVTSDTPAIYRMCGISLHDGNLMIPEYDDGFRLYSLEDPAHPLEIAHYTVDTNGGGLACGGKMVDYHDVTLCYSDDNVVYIYQIGESGVERLGDLYLGWYPTMTVYNDHLYSSISDGFVILQESATGVESGRNSGTNSAVPTVSLFPNPSNSAPKITLGVDSPQKVALTVYNLLGQEIFAMREFVPSGRKSYSLLNQTSRLATGHYFVRVDLNRQQTLVPFTIIK